MAGWAAPREGRVVSPRLELLLLDSQGQLRAFDKAALREITVIKDNPKTSYRSRLTTQELADVVGYLVTLKGTRASRP